MIRSRAYIAFAGISFALMVAACGDGDSVDQHPTATAAAVEEGVVVVSMTTGCDQPEPGRGTELLAMVSVMRTDGSPVVEAQVEGSAAGPGVLASTASDATFLDGEALLLFPVGELGSYAVTVDSVTLSTGEAAAFHEASEPEATFEIGGVCTPP